MSDSNLNAGKGWTSGSISSQYIVSTSVDLGTVAYASPAVCQLKGHSVSDYIDRDNGTVVGYCDRCSDEVHLMAVPDGNLQLRIENLIVAMHDDPDRIVELWGGVIESFEQLKTAYRQSSALLDMLRELLREDLSE